MAFEACRCYWQRFLVSQWKSLEITVVDYDSNTAADLMGKVVVPMATTSLSEVEIMCNGITGGKLRYSIEYRTYPESARISGAWRVRIVQARDLKGKDMAQLKATSDPFVVVTALCHDERLRCMQYTTAKRKVLAADWDEVLEFPICSSSASDSFLATLEHAVPSCTANIGDELSSQPGSDDVAFEQFQDRIARCNSVNRELLRTNFRENEPEEAGSQLGSREEPVLGNRSPSAVCGAIGKSEATDPSARSLEVASAQQPITEVDPKETSNCCQPCHCM